MFTPALPEKTEAARGLPLGLADKLFFRMHTPRGLFHTKGVHFFGAIDRLRAAELTCAAARAVRISRMLFRRLDSPADLEKRRCEHAFEIAGHRRAIRQKHLGADVRQPTFTPIACHVLAESRPVRARLLLATRCPGMTDERLVLASPGRRSPVFCRRGVLARAFLDCARRLYDRDRGGATGYCANSRRCRCVRPASRSVDRAIGCGDNCLCFS